LNNIFKLNLIFLRRCFFSGLHHPEVDCPEPGLIRELHARIECATIPIHCH